MNIRISADSTCDLSPELVRENGVTITPLYIVCGEKSLVDGVDIAPDDVFAWTRDHKKPCSTAAVNVADYLKVFGELRQECDAVIHFTISAEMSSCYLNACTAAEQIGGVYVIDSRSLSTGIGHLVLDACEMARAGMDAETIFNTLQQRKELLDVSFVIDTLFYLQKGGRCSTLAALGANLLKLKPCIEVKDGKMGVGKKYRGKIDNCIAQYVRERLQGRDDLRRNRIFITHSGCAPEIVENVKAIIKECGGFDEVLETYAGCTVSSHCGPNTLGVLFVRK